MNSVFDYTDNFHKIYNIPSVLIYGSKEKCASPIVSVIMPVYKKNEYLEQSLRSVINQSCIFNYEIVVVDNNSCVGSNENQKIIERLNSPKILYYKNAENVGMMNNWNRGIELSRAELITFCHDDDLLLPNALQTLYDLYVKTKSAIMSAYEEIDDKGKQCGISCFAKEELTDISLFDMFISNRSNGEGCIFERKRMLEIGGFNDWYYPVSDYALFTAYIRKYGIKYYSNPVFCYRIAANESYSAMAEAPEKTNYILEDIASLFRLPLFLRRLLVRVRVKQIEQAAYSIWNCELYKASKPTWLEQKVLSVCCKLHNNWIIRR